MRNFLLIVLITISSFSFSQEAAAAYMNVIDQTVKLSTDQLDEYINAVLENKPLRKLDKQLSELQLDIQNGQKVLKKSKGFKGDKEYLEAAMAFLNSTDSILTNGYKALQERESVAVKSVKEMRSYLLDRMMVNDRMANIYRSYQKHKSSFAEGYKVNVLTNDKNLGNTIKKSQEVYQYYNRIYLHYFACQIIEKQILQSINTENIQELDSLITVFKDTVKQNVIYIESAPSYKGNRDLAIVTGKVIDFYKNEIQGFEKMLEYIRLKEEMTMLQGKIQSGKASKEEKSKFNSNIETINSLGESVNAETMKQNKKRSEITNEWNERSRNFILKYL
jgi:hypothetical protein